MSGGNFGQCLSTKLVAMQIGTLGGHTWSMLLGHAMSAYSICVYTDRESTKFCADEHMNYSS